MQDTEWEYSNEEPIANDFAQPVEGPQYLVITKAEVDSEEHYNLGFKSLTNEAFVNVRYFLFARDQETGDAIPDAKQRRVLVSLKKALYGPEAVGIPNPVDIIGAVVEADVKLKAPTAKGVRYPAIYNYKPVPTSIAEGFGVEGQYSIPDEQELEE